MKMLLQIAALLMVLVPQTYAAVSTDTEKGLYTPAQVTEQIQVMDFLGLYPHHHPILHRNVECVARDHRNLYYSAIGVFPGEVQNAAMRICERHSWGCAPRGCHRY